MSPESMMTAYMLAQMADDEAYADQDVEAARSTLGKTPLFAACTGANDKLRELVEADATPSACNLMDVLFSRQTRFFCAFTKGSPFFQHWRSLFTLETLYTGFLAQSGAEVSASEQESQLWRSRRDVLLSPDAVTTLKLTQWQLRALLLPGSPWILSDWQAFLFRQIFCSETLSSPRIDLAQFDPAPVQFEWSVLDKPLRKKYAGLSRLLGNLQPPIHHPIPPASDSATCVHVQPEVEPEAIIPSTFTADALPPAQTEANHTPEIEEVTNPFMGKSYSPAKRTGSPLVDASRPRKTSRLGGFVRRDLVVDELLGHWETHQQQLLTKREFEDKMSGFRDELQQATTEIQAIKSRIIADSNSAQTITGSVQKQAAALSGLSQDMQMLNDKAAGVRTQVDNLATKMTNAADKQDTTLADLRDGILGETTKVIEIERGKILVDVTRALEKQKGELFIDLQSMIHSALKSHRDAQEKTQDKPLLPGQAGFLAQCSASAQWQQSQKAYESALFRAAWLYIQILGSPEDGLKEDGEDAEAFEEVRATHPGLDVKHIISALDHVHMEAYGRPFPRRSQQNSRV